MPASLFPTLYLYELMGPTEKIASITHTYNCHERSWIAIVIFVFVASYCTGIVLYCSGRRR